jgi:hypothetical protein
MAAPIGEETLTSFKFSDFADFFMSAARLHWCKIVSRTNILVHYKDKQNVSNTSPIQLDSPIQLAGVSGKGNAHFSNDVQIYGIAKRT